MKNYDILNVGYLYFQLRDRNPFGFIKNIFNQRLMGLEWHEGE